jgi:predicted metal-binding membrane protein
VQPVDPSDLRGTIADALLGGAPLEAETVNMACFLLSRSLEEMAFSTPQAAPLVRCLLRVAGRVVIDTGTQGADPSTWSNTEAMVLEWMEEAVQPLGYRLTPIEDDGGAGITRAVADW